MLSPARSANRADYRDITEPRGSRKGKRPAEGLTGQGESYVRRHVKASSAGSKMRQRGKVRALIVAFAAISVVFALSPALAGATKVHFYLEDFGSLEKPTFES